MEDFTPPEMIELALAEFDELLETGHVTSTSYLLDQEGRIAKIERFMIADVLPGRHVSFSLEPQLLAANLPRELGADVITALVASDHGLATDIAAQLLATDGEVEVVATCEELGRLEAIVLGHRPDVVVLVASPFGSLADRASARAMSKTIEQLASFINANSLDAQILVLGHDRADLAREALVAGAAGVYGPADGIDEIRRAVSEVARGRSYVSPSLARTVFARPDGDGVGSLTPRERQVLRCIALGYTNKECAEELFLSVRTVEKHHANVKKRLNLDSRREIVAFALKNNLLFTALAVVFTLGVLGL